MDVERRGGTRDVAALAPEHLLDHRAIGTTLGWLGCIALGERLPGILLEVHGLDNRAAQILGGARGGSGLDQDDPRSSRSRGRHTGGGRVPMCPVDVSSV